MEPKNDDWLSQILNRLRQGGLLVGASSEKIAALLSQEQGIELDPDSEEMTYRLAALDQARVLQFDEGYVDLARAPLHSAILKHLGKLSQGSFVPKKVKESNHELTFEAAGKSFRIALHTGDRQLDPCVFSELNQSGCLGEKTVVSVKYPNDVDLDPELGVLILVVHPSERAALEEGLQWQFLTSEEERKQCPNPTATGDEKAKPSKGKGKKKVSRIPWRELLDAAELELLRKGLFAVVHHKRGWSFHAGDVIKDVGQGLGEMLDPPVVYSLTWLASSFKARIAEAVQNPEETTLSILEQMRGPPREGVLQLATQWPLSAPDNLSRHSFASLLNETFKAGDQRQIASSIRSDGKSMLVKISLEVLKTGLENRLVLDAVRLLEAYGAIRKKRPEAKAKSVLVETLSEGLSSSAEFALWAYPPTEKEQELILATLKAAAPALTE